MTIYCRFCTTSGAGRLTVAVVAPGGLGDGVVPVLGALVIAQVQHQDLLTDAHLVAASGSSEGSSCCHCLLLGGLLNVAPRPPHVTHVTTLTAPGEECLAAHLTPRLRGRTPDQTFLSRMEEEKVKTFTCSDVDDTYWNILLYSVLL